MNRQASTTYRKTIIAIHVAVWLVVFLAPLTFFNRGDRFETEKLVPMISSPLAMMAVFYTMYLHITPRYFFAQDRRRFWILTVTLVVTVGVLLHLWMNFAHGLFPKPAGMMHHIPPEHRIRMDVWMILRNISSMAVATAIATMSIITMRWQEAETARQEAELARQKADTARADAELKNLRNQINPHFLLNTLNNIYALTAFDPTRAQEAIMQLSGMLRHILYDNQQDYVPLNNEVKFILSYVNLMKMRLTKSCDVKVDVDVAEQNNIKVAPLIFISLIENAFKHGIAAEGKSFIHINIKADNEKIACCIENSNHPKKQTDRSGHGIGLEQVGRRLELAYPGKYLWEKGVKENESIYYSKIIIYDTELRDY